MKVLYYNIGKRATDIRETNNCTIPDLAEKMNLSVKHCNRVERGETTFSMEKMIQFCNLFGVSLDYLIRGKNPSDEVSPIIPQTVIDIMSSDDENAKKIFLEYLKILDTPRK